MPIESESWLYNVFDSQRRLLETLFGRVPVGVALLDRDLVLRRCNAVWAEFVSSSTNTPIEQIVPGARFLDIAPGSETTSLPRYRRALSGETVCEEGVPMRSNGTVSYWDVVLSPLILEGGVVAIVDVTISATERIVALREARDQRGYLERSIAERTAALREANSLLQAEVEERAKAESALREERNFSAAVLDTVGALVIVLDRQGAIVGFNRACERISGYTLAEVSGKKFWQVLTVPEEVESMLSGFAGLSSGDVSLAGQAHWLTKSGERRLIDWSNATLAGPDGKVKYIIGTGIDITESKATEQALKASEEQYRDLVENVNSIILRMDTDGRVMFFNSYAERFFGFKEEEILGRSVVGTIVPSSDAAGRDLRQMVQEIATQPERYAANENENVLKDGQRVWVSWTNRAILDEQGRVKEILCVGNDVSDRRRASEALRQAHELLELRVEERTAQLSRANQELQQEIAERHRVESALRERVELENLVMQISTRFINLPPEDLDSGINATLRALGEFAGVDRSYVFIYTDDQRFASNTHEWCAPGVQPEIANLQGIDVRTTPWWTRMHLSGNVIHIESVEDLPPELQGEKNNLSAQGIKSLVSVPLVYGGKTVGFLGFDSVRAKKTWPEESVKLLRVVGETIVNAIERAKAGRALQKAYQTLEERVEDRTRELYTLLAVQQAISSRLNPDDMLQMIADEARRLTSSRISMVFLMADEENMHVAVVSGEIERSIIGTKLPVDGSLAGLAVRTGKPHSSADTRADPRPDATMVQRVGARNMLVVPLIYGNHTIGGLALANKTSGPYGPEDERRLVMLAAGAAIDLENAQLFQEEQERRREAEQRRRVAEGLRDILAILNSNRPLQEVLDYIVAQACRMMDTDAGALYRLEPDSAVLSIQAAQGLSREYVNEVRIPLGRGVVGRSVQMRRPVAIDDLSSTLVEDPFVFVDGQRKHIERLVRTYKAILAVPLTVKDEVYGGIVLYYPESRVFSDDEIALAVTFGDQAALAIENARLRSQAEQAAVAAERSRLARDLHDAVTQTLFSASLIAEVLPRIWERNSDEGRRRLEELRQLTRGALAEMRTLLLELRPSALTEAALPELLRQLAEALTGRARIPTSLNITGERALSAEVQVALYRIAQEALNNVAKHSGASKASIDLCYDSDAVRLSIQDDGRGFDPEIVGPEHLGLGIMRERAEGIGATITLDSESHVGTRVEVIWRSDKSGEPD